MLRLLTLFSLLLTLNTTVHAEDRTRPSLNMSQQMTITYGSPSWNTDSAKIDSAYLVMRDRSTGKLVQIQLEETEPDSSEFSGAFSVNLSESETISPEVYIPRQNQRGENDYKKLYRDIAKGTLARKPVILKRSERGPSRLEVYDTREQAATALKIYNDGLKLASGMKERAHKTSVQEKSASASLDKMAEEASTREADRLRLEQIEKQRTEERLAQAQKASESVRQARRARALKLSAQGDARYSAGDFKEAESKYHQAVELDPENNGFYFKYGVTLYRNSKFNEALVTLKLAQVDPQSDIERQYYMGLSHYRLGEIDQALQVFLEISKSEDPVMGPSATFYAGVLHFTKENYAASKADFEKVIDTSKDPRMDDQAEEYLDRIASQMIYQKLREHKFNVQGTVGVMYDSNVLLSSDSAKDQGSTTNLSDVRFLTVAQVGYRPLLTPHHELSANLNASLTNSMKNQSASADPFLYNLAVPYSYSGQLWKKGSKTTIKPAYEILYMDPSSTGTKSLTLNSYYVDFDQTLLMSKNWFSTYTFEYRHDDSKTIDSVGPEDADASKLSLRMVQAVFLDKAKKEAILGNLGYVLNAAKGDNKKYHRIELGSTYLRPIGWGSSLILGLQAYQLNYSSAATPRKDLNVTCSTALSKPIRDWVTWGLSGSYTRNNSDQTSYVYSKYLVMTTASFNADF